MREFKDSLRLMGFLLLMPLVVFVIISFTMILFSTYARFGYEYGLHHNFARFTATEISFLIP